MEDKVMHISSDVDDSLAPPSVRYTIIVGVPGYVEGEVIVSAYHVVVVPEDWWDEWAVIRVRVVERVGSIILYWGEWL